MRAYNKLMGLADAGKPVALSFKTNGEKLLSLYAGNEAIVQEKDIAGTESISKVADNNIIFIN